MRRSYLPRDTQQLLVWYERFVSPLFLVGGFIIDNVFLLKRVDFVQTHIVIGIHLFISLGGIFLLNALNAGRIKKPWIVALAPFIPIVIQFSLGSLLAGYLSLYSRSAELITTWITVAALAILLISNERLFRFYSRFPFQMSLYFLALLAYFIFAFPVFLHSIGPAMFLLACASAVAAISLIMILIAIIAREQVRPKLLSASVSILAILAMVNLLYFTNSIPPLPLSLKDAGIYHSVVRVEGGYIFRGEVSTWGQTILNQHRFHGHGDELAFLYTSIFAPDGIEVPITHQWQFYDATSSAWITKDTITFPIIGGRDGGYRGYSKKDELIDGLWRVNVLTSSGSYLGRISFVVNHTDEPVELTEFKK